MRTHWLIGKSRSSSDTTQAGEDQPLQLPNHVVCRSQSSEGRVAKVRPYAFNSSSQLSEKQERSEQLISTLLSPSERQPIHRVISRASSLIDYRSPQKQQYSSSSDHGIGGPTTCGFQRAILTSVSQSDSSDDDHLNGTGDHPRLVTSRSDTTNSSKENNNRIINKLIKIDKSKHMKRRQNFKSSLSFENKTHVSQFTVKMNNSTNHLSKVTQTSPDTTNFIDGNNFV
jgi:hypothetical protein